MKCVAKLASKNKEEVVVNIDVDRIESFRNASSSRVVVTMQSGHSHTLQHTYDQFQNGYVRACNPELDKNAKEESESND